MQAQVCCPLVRFKQCTFATTTLPKPIAKRAFVLPFLTNAYAFKGRSYSVADYSRQ